MVKFTIDQLRTIMDNQNNIRNMSVIAHVDHGKSTLTDSLIARAGIISDDNVGDVKYMESSKVEKDRGITIKSTGVSLYYEYGEDIVEKYLINLIDSPGHVDFSSEVTAALRVTDGALVVVDYVEGVCIQTEIVVRQALMELVKPVLMINKVDRAFFELRNDSETIYQNFQRVIESFNVIVSTYQKIDDMGDCQVNPIEGQVAMGSALQGWGFTLNTFAKMYSKKFKINEKKLVNKLWGDNFYDGKNWVSEQENEITRSFCFFIIDPIKKLVDAIMTREEKYYLPFLEKIGVKLELNEKELVEKKLVKKVMLKWINASDALLEMIINHLPSPKVAQKYRTSYLYEGLMDDECAIAMSNCDPEGPLMMFISKMVPSGVGGRFYAFGRVFSGKVEKSKKVKIMGTKYKLGSKDDLFEKNIQGVVIMMGKKAEDVLDIPCGNICALIGIDQCLTNQGTISNNSKASTIKCMKYSVSPVVRVAVGVKNPIDLPKLVEGLNRMSKAENAVQVTITDTETVVAGTGELHLEVCLKDLTERYTNNIEIIKSEPIVTYMETISENSSEICLAKSSNKHNRLFVTAEPLNIDFIEKVEREDDIKGNINLLVDEFGWDKNDFKKIWIFGPDSNGTNLIVDQTSSVQNLHEARDSIENTFQWVARSGVVAEENMRGIRFNLLDAVLHSDAIHRGGNQLIPAVRKALLGSQLLASPKLVEPLYLVDIIVPQDAVNGVYSCLNLRRGVVFSEENLGGTPLLQLKAYLPVSESFGFTTQLRALTSGQAFPQCVFDHWEILNDNPLDKKSQSFAITMNIRKRKGLKLDIPVKEDYLDKL